MAWGEETPFFFSFTDWNSIVEMTHDTTNKTLCLDNHGKFYAHPNFAISMLIPVLLCTIFMIPHWLKLERSCKRLIKTLPFLIFQVYPQMKMAEILYFAILKRDKKWKTKKEALQKEIGSLGKGQFNHNQESICSNKI